MCTLVATFNDGLVIGFNRDERPERPTGPLKEHSKGIFYREDLWHGGTYLGYNINTGIVAAITNYDNPNNEYTKDKVSRGVIVRDILQCTGLENVYSFLDNIDYSDQKLFNMLVGSDKWLLHVATSMVDLSVRRLSPGNYIATGNGFNNHNDTRQRKLLTELSKREIGAIMNDEIINMETFRHVLSLPGNGTVDDIIVKNSLDGFVTISQDIIQLKKPLRFSFENYREIEPRTFEMKHLYKTDMSNMEWKLITHDITRTDKID